MVLPEIVGGAAPQAAVVHPVALGSAEGWVGPILDKVFVKAVEAAEAHAVHIIICAHACVCVKAVVVVACRDAVPCLAGLFVIAEVLVADF